MRRTLLLLALPIVLLILCLAGTSQGQAPPLAAKANLDADFAKIKQQLPKLFSGEQPPQGKEDDDLMKVLARYYVYRVTLPQTKEAMDKLHIDLEQNLLHPLTQGKNNRVFIDKLGTPLAKCLEDVLVLDFLPNRVAVVNGALLLPPIAKLQQEKVGDLLVKLLKDEKTHDVVKLYAAKAMVEFFPAAIYTERTNPKEKAQFELNRKRVQALVDFMTRPIPERLDPEAYCYMRREAGISLARAGVPALSGLNKSGVEGPVAYELLRVLLKKGENAYKPPTSLPERVEAALGLCLIKDNPTLPDQLINYDPSMAVYAVGLCFQDCLAKYSKQLTELQLRKNVKAPTEGSKIPEMAWRVQNERFKFSLKEMVDNTAKTPAQANAKRLEKEISRLATIMLNYQAVSDDQERDFRALVETLAPKSNKVYDRKEENVPKIESADLKDWPAAAGE
jgi:hypothetical protein